MWWLQRKLPAIAHSLSWTSVAVLLLAVFKDWPAAGDYKDGYVSHDYVTRSVALDTRTPSGQKTNPY